MESSRILTVKNLSKSYRGVHALKGVDFELLAGEIHALCGENGAGKSTLVRIVAGLADPDEGEVRIDGELLKRGRKTTTNLVSVVYQELSIIPDLTVLENVLLGDRRLGRIFLASRFAAEVKDVLARVGLDVPLGTLAGRLTVAEQQLLEICRAVMRRSKVLILDEPTASLSDAEIERVFATVRWLQKSGTAVIYISHRLPEIFELTNRATVFRNGRRVLTKRTCDWTSGELVREMIGREVAEAQRHPTEVRPPEQLPIVAFSDFQARDQIAASDLRLARGEIVGVIGQLGSGANVLVEALAGLEHAYEGKIAIDGREVILTSQTAAVRSGIAYVTEDRGGKSLFRGATVQENLTSANLPSFTRWGLVDRKSAKASATQLARRFQIDVGRLGADISTLSGGNQQKVAIAKSVALSPKVLVLNEPTRGVDVGARAEIYKELRELASNGMSVFYFSTDLEEIKTLSQRIVTVFKGKIVSDRPAAEMTSDRILTEILRGSSEEEIAA